MSATSSLPLQAPTASAAVSLAPLSTTGTMGTFQILPIPAPAAPAPGTTQAAPGAATQPGTTPEAC